MSDPHDSRHSEPPPLESWALELERDSDPQTRQELARVVGLLRDLPDLEPPPEMLGRVLERIATQRARPRLLRGVFGDGRRVARQPLGLALAAGVAGLFVWAVSGSLPLADSLQTGTPTRNAAVQASPSVRVADGSASGLRQPPRVRQPAVAGLAARRRAAVIRPQLVSLFANAPSAGHRRSFERSPQALALERHLDNQLNQLMLDPAEFARRLERVNPRDAFFARLSNRAAERGDAPEIALRLRQSDHPLAAQLGNRMLRASMIERISPGAPH